MAGWVWLVLAGVLGVPGSVLLVVGIRALWLPAPHRRFLGFRPLLERAVRWRLGGYEHVHTEPDPSLPREIDRTHRVAIVGAGLAGMAAATVLAERGVSVTLIDANTYLGGKLGAWPTAFSDGQEVMVDHGFHAFFHQYYNLNRFLDRLGVLGDFEPVSEYLILRPDGGSTSFRDVEPAPALNLVDLTLKGHYDWRSIVRDPAASAEMEHLLRYDPEHTFDLWDDVSFAEFSERASLQSDLQVTFTSFTRAFFAEPDKMSMAELIKSFHVYYLSHAWGLDYVYPVEDYHHAVLEPWRELMEEAGVDIRLGAPVERITRREGGFEVDGEWHDELILAAHLPGTRAIVEGSPDLTAGAPELARRLGVMHGGQRYAVLRAWLDKDIRDGLPTFTVTHRRDVLDSVTTYHRFERASRQWVADHEGGSVLELHCYAVPDDLTDEDQLRDRLFADLFHFFPELDGASVRREVMQVRADFPAFHRGLWRHRPSTRTSVEGLYLAGDWVKLPFPAMLMEAAYSSGLLAANAVLERLGLQQERVTQVPQTGLLAGLPSRPRPRTPRKARVAK